MSRATGGAQSYTGRGWEKLGPTMREWLGREGVSDDGSTYRVYHGTQEPSLAAIRREGLRTPEGTVGRWYMVTTNARQAARYTAGRAAGSRRVIEYRIPVDAARRYLGVGVESHAYADETGPGTNHHLLSPLPADYIAAVHDVG